MNRGFRLRDGAKYGVLLRVGHDASSINDKLLLFWIDAYDQMRSH